MSILAVRIRVRAPVTRTVGMPLSGALAAFPLTLEKESAAPGAGAPTSPPRPWAVGELPALEQAVARRSGAAIRRASLRIVFTSFRRSCVRRRQAGELGSPALPEELLGVPGDLSGEVADVDAALPGERRVGRRDVEGLVPAATGILWGQVRRIGLSEEPIGRDARRGGAEPVAPRVRQGAGERDVEAEVEPGRQLVRTLAVTVHHPADVEPLAEDRSHAIS